MTEKEIIRLNSKMHWRDGNKSGNNQRFITLKSITINIKKW